MREVIRSVFYCDHCGRHRLSRRAIADHEPTCTLNPARACKWHASPEPDDSVDAGALAVALRERAPLAKGDVEWLRAQVDECPACVLAALRQSGVEYHYDAATGDRLFDYGEQVERFRAWEREEEQRAEWRAIEGSFL